jgi:hypothetical protein
MDTPELGTGALSPLANLLTFIVQKPLLGCLLPSGEDLKPLATDNPIESAKSCFAAPEWHRA